MGCTSRRLLKVLVKVKLRCLFDLLVLRYAFTDVLNVSSYLISRRLVALTRRHQGAPLPGCVGGALEVNQLWLVTEKPDPWAQAPHHWTVHPDESGGTGSHAHAALLCEYCCIISRSCNSLYGGNPNTALQFFRRPGPEPSISCRQGPIAQHSTHGTNGAVLGLPVFQYSMINMRPAAM